MNRGLDCKDTIYELTFPREAKVNLHRLAKILNKQVRDDIHHQVCDNGSEAPISFIVTHYQEIDDA